MAQELDGNVMRNLCSRRWLFMVGTIGSNPFPAPHSLTQPDTLPVHESK